MKKWLVTTLLCILITGQALAASNALTPWLPLLQKHSRTEAENQKVLQLFRTSKSPEVVFAAGATLVKTPPSKVQEPALFNILLRGQDGLRQTFSAVIITAMGSVHEELLPVLQQAQSSKDPALRAYATAAQAIISPATVTQPEEIVRLYIFDPSFAARAMNVYTGNEKSPLKILKSSAKSQDEQVRAAAASWLGALHTPDATKQLLKMAGKESAPTVQAAIATGLALQRQDILPTISKGLKKSYTSPYANTCALTLGFMTGNAVDTVRQHLLSSSEQSRINASRAAAYMASVLASPDAFAYSSDRAFDVRLLKGLIAPLKALANSGSETEKTYAKNALLQIEKLME